MSNLEVRKPDPTAQAKAQAVEQVLARVRAGRADPSKMPPEVKLQAPVVRAPAKPEPLAKLEAKRPPGPQTRGPAPLKGPAPTRAAAATAAAGAARASAASNASAKPAAARPAAAKPAPVTASSLARAAQATTAPARVPANSLIDENAPWLPDEADRKAAFLQVYRYWHYQVRPEFSKKARPAFLFLVTALPVMIKARDTLKSLNLWEPPGEHSRQLRDQHAAWKKYCEFLPRATEALQELDDYRHLSLLTAMDDLSSRITKAEARFREPAPTPAKGKR
jgi:hypothetical protein